MSGDPVNVYCRVCVILIITNALPKMLNELGVLSTSTVVKAKGIVSEATVCVNVDVINIIVSNTEFNANTNRNDLACVI